MVINPLYVDRGVLKSAKRIYRSQQPKNIRLDNFFQPAMFSLLQKKLFDAKYKTKFHPYRHKYSTAMIKEISSFLKGRYFADIVKSILNSGDCKIKHEIRRFGPGDYTLLHDTEREQADVDAGVDFYLDFSKPCKNYGGYTVYLTETKELLQLNPCPNTLSFIECGKGVMSYTKYVTSRQEYPIVQVVGRVLNR